MAFEPPQLDDSYHKPMSPAATIAYLEQALVFIANGWFYGPFFRCAPLYINGWEVSYPPVFSIKRADGGKERLLQNYSACDSFGLSFNSCQVTNFISMPTYENIVYVM